VAQKPLVIQSLTPSVPLELRINDANGEHVLNFRLLFNFDAYALVEASANINMLMPGLVFKLLGDPAGPGATLLSVLLWAAIVNSNQDSEYAGESGLQAVRSYLNYDNSARVAEALQEAFLFTLPEEQQKALREGIAKAKAEAEAGIGTEVGADPLVVAAPTPA
jgi:hypothetical protein